MKIILCYYHITASKLSHNLYIIEHFTGKKNKIITVPNICPFKTEILKEVEEYKKRKEEEKIKQKEIWKAENEANKVNGMKGLEKLVADANAKAVLHENFEDDPMGEIKVNEKKDNSIKAYYKEFKKASIKYSVNKFLIIY